MSKIPDTVDLSESNPIYRNPIAAMQTPSSSREGKIHVTVLLDEDNAWCSCEGYQYTDSCRHIQDLREEVV